MNHKNKQLMRSLFQEVILLSLMSVLALTCKYPTGPLKDNTLPHTRLANVPANDTIAKFIDRNIIPELQLNWLGDDPDGYVIAYQYRWVTKAGINEPWPAPPEWNTHLNLSKPEWLNVVTVKSYGKDTEGRPTTLFNIYNYLATLGPNDTAITRVVAESLFTGRTFAVPYKTGVVSTDSIAGAPQLVLQTPTIGTFIFDSPDTANFHRFDVRAVDNSNSADPIGASVYFWTLKSPGSLVVMDSRPAANSFAIRNTSDTWPGLHFTYHALDANNGFGIEYQWNVDDTLNSWSDWSPTGEAYVTASDFKDVNGQPKPDSSGWHSFYVRAKNRWSVLSPIVRDTFRVVVPAIDDPTYAKRVLVINDDLNGGPPLYNGIATPGYPTLDQVDSVYNRVMGSLGKTYRIWHVKQGTSVFWPSRDTLGNYTSVLLLIEQKTVGAIGAGRNQAMQTSFQDDLREYLDIGGKLIYSGPPAILNYNGVSIVGTMIVNYSGPGGFAENPLHVFRNFLNMERDFVGVRGVLGYPDVHIDSTKLAPDSLGAMRFIASNIPLRLAETISTFDSKSNGAFENTQIGIRFLSPRAVPPLRQTYSVVFFGFPLFYADEAAITGSLQKAFDDLNE